MDAMIGKAKVHIEFCTELYAYQMRQGRYFLHEHPQSAGSWKLPEVEKLAANPVVFKAILSCAVSAWSPRTRPARVW